MTSMTVLYLKDTRHVLGAVSRTADPPTPPAVADLAPGGIRVRAVPGTSGARLDATVEANRLEVATVAVDASVLADPRSYSVTPGDKPTVDRISPTATATVTLTAVLAEVTTTSTVDLKVLMVVEKVSGSAPAPLMLTGVLTANKASFPVSLDKGDWQAVAFVAGRPAAGLRKTIP